MGLGLWLGRLGLRLGRCGLFGSGGGLFGFGVGREAVVVVAFDGIADGFAPAVGVEGVDVFLLGDVDGLQEGLDQVGDGAGGSGFYIAANDGGDEACQGGAEIAGGEVVTGKEVGQVFAEFFCGAGPGFFLGVVEAEMRVTADAGSAATAAVRESKRTQGTGLREGIKVSLELSFGIAEQKRAQAEACATNEKERREDAGATKRNASRVARGSVEQENYTTTAMRVKLKN